MIVPIGALSAAARSTRSRIANSGPKNLVSKTAQGEELLGKDVGGVKLLLPQQQDPLHGQVEKLELQLLRKP